MSHTPEPWKFISYDLHGVLITSIECGDECLADDIDPNVGERIVACVNACAGMETPADGIAKLKSERLELLKALESLLDVTADSKGVAGYHLNGDIAEWNEFECVGEAYELIRRIEGGIAQSEAD